MSGLRWAAAAEADALAALWHAAWRDGHVGHVPDELVAQRTAERFAWRVGQERHRMRVAGPVGAPLGLCIVDGSELYQLFVDERARGTGVAGRLLADAEARMREAGVTRAMLRCAVGNERAAAFYRAKGWTLDRTEETLFGREAGEGVPVRTWVFGKDL